MNSNVQIVQSTEPQNINIKTEAWYAVAGSMTDCIPPVISTNNIIMLLGTGPCLCYITLNVKKLLQHIDISQIMSQ